MAKIKDLNMLLSLIGEGQTIAEINELWPAAMKTLREMSEDQPRKTHKGKITLAIKVEVKDGVAEVGLDVKIDLPKRPSRSTIFWIGRMDGFLTTEHSSQIAMFDGNKPRITIDGDPPVFDRTRAGGSTE